MELFPIYDQNSTVTANIWYSVSGLGECPSMRVGHTIVHDNSNNTDDQEGSKKGKLYVIGGANPSGSFNDVYVLDMNTLSWDKCDEMSCTDAGGPFEKGRYEHASFKMIQDDRLRVYIFGGSNEDGSLNDMLEFDFQEKK